MKTNRVLLIAVVVMTVLCAALVWSNVVAAGRARQLKAQLETSETKLKELEARDRNAARQTVDTGMGELLAQRDAEYEQLHDAYDKLKEQLAATKAVNVAVPAVTSTPTRASFSPFFRRNGMSNYLERVRLQDPARYTEIVQRIQQRQQQAAEEYDDQMAGLVQRAQNAATPEEADLVSQITDTLDKINQLRQSRAAVADLPEDQQQTQLQSINEQMHDAMQQLGQLRDQDRTMQYQQLADQLGLKGQDAQNLVQGIPQILKNTQYTPQRGPGGFGGLGGGTAAGTTGSGASTSSSTTPSSQPSSTATK
ncbi:MAG TPA: hypothetical protein VL486_05725 [Verrucomicrobiae bacterium]|nr:hypothetical protein [Verrucomicrobiae bacterium]